MNLPKFGFLLSAVLFFGLHVGCVPTLTGPNDPSSTLVIGRVSIDNKFPGSFHGILPLGVVDKGLEIEIESRDGTQALKVVTEEQGYFFVPNLAPNTYYILRVTIEGGASRGDREKYGLIMRRPTFTPVPGKVTYVGTLLIDLSERSLSKIREVREDEKAKTYFLQRFSASPWSSREFVSVGPRATSVLQGSQEKAPAIESKRDPTGVKAERPTWKTGYQWRYAWTQPGRKGTLTREVVREEILEGVSTYVLRIGKNEYFLTKDALAEVAGVVRGKLSFTRTPPPQTFRWPLEVGKEWRNTYLRDNIQEKTSRTFDYRMVIASDERINVPAGTFDAFKIEEFDFYSGKLLTERWYSPIAKWYVKLRFYREDGMREEELLSFKVD